MNPLPEKKLILLNQDVNASMLTCESAWAGSCDPRLVEQMGFMPIMYGEIIKGQTINWYMEPGLMNQLIVTARTTLLCDKELVVSLKQNTEKCTHEIIEHATRSLTRIELGAPEVHVEVLSECQRLYREISFFGSAIAFADIDGGITEYTLDILRTKLDKNDVRLHEYHHALSTPEPLSMTEEAMRHIRSGMEPADAIREYFWLNQGYIGRGLTLGEVGFLRETLELKPYSALTSPAVDLSEEEKHAFLIARELIYLKSLRADARQFLNVVTNRIADIYAAKWNLNQTAVSTMTFNELIECIHKKVVFNSNVANRVEHSLYIRHRDGYLIYMGKEVDDLLRGKILRDLGEGNSVKGQVAQPGKVSGPARLVFGPQHNDKVKVGDILISVATSPQLLPAMYRAAAFVTDVGGVTSHAAIVARELSKPCVVGTKLATQIFRDGDMVEVDAERGIVKKL